MSDTKKDKAKIMKKVSRKQNPLPPEQVISPNKKAYKRKPINVDIEEYDEEAIYQEELYESQK